MSLKLVDFVEGYTLMLFFRDGGQVNFDITDPHKDIQEKKDVLIIVLEKGDVVEVQKSALAMHRVKYFKRPADLTEPEPVQASTGEDDLR